MLTIIKIRQIALPGLLAFILAFIIAVLPQPVSSAGLDDDDDDPPQDLILRGDGKCTACHDENSDN
ncbi:MAG: hypothetical protein LZF64_06530, partial [Nitrosomonas sp.]